MRGQSFMVCESLAGTPGATNGIEAKLLLACSRVHMTPEETAAVRALAEQPLNWGRFCHLAMRHGVVPLVYRSLKAACPELVPRPVLDQLRVRFMQSAHRSAVLSQEMVRLVQLMRAEGMSAVPFKGPVLAAAAYGDPLLRQFCDLDILVRHHELPAATQLLLREGYRRAYQPIDASGLNFAREDGQWSVDLHDRFTNRHYPFGLYSGQFWQRLETIEVGGTSVPTLCRDDLLIFLCMHGAKHSYPNLRCVCDIAELLRSGPVDWDVVLGRARALGATRVLLLGLWLAHDLLGAPVPDHVLPRIADDGTVPRLAAQARRWMLSDRPSAYVSEQLIYPLRVRERIRDRLPYLLYIMHRMMTVNERDREFATLPPALSALYYVLRPIRMIRDYGWTLLKGSRPG